ncbi:MAG TPA: TonB family protein [Candidatus Baltobacteraceae bacterium]
MTRARRVLVVAFAISILLHLLLAHFARLPLSSRNDKPELVTLDKRRAISVVRMTPHPIPTTLPTPRAPRPHVVSHSIRSAPAVVHRSAGPSGPPHGNGPGASATVSPPTPPPPPVPTAMPAGGCAHPEASPAVLATPPAPDIAPDARAKATSGTTAVNVRLDADGRVASAAVASSSGNADLDIVAVSMARAASYTPKYVACKAVAADYTFTVKFVAW